MSQFRLPRLTSDRAIKRLSMLLEHMGESAETVIQNPKTGAFKIDANTSAVFHRQLLFVEKELYRVEYPELKARELIPVDTSIPSAAASFMYRMFDKVGEAKLVTDWSTDFPNVDVSGQEFVAKVYHFGDSYTYTTQELRESAMAGFQINTERAETAREMIERKLDQVAATGLAGTSLGGLANNANVPLITAGLTRNWATGSTTGESQKADVQVIWNRIFTQSPNQVEADSLVLSPEAYADLNRPMNGFNQENAIDFIRRTTPIKSISFWSKLRNAGAGGVDRAVFYKKDPKVVKLVVPQDIEQSPVFAKFFSLTTALHLSTGGVVIRQPLAMAYVDGFHGAV